MKTEDLIKSLVHSSEPIQPLRPIWVRFAQWALIAIFCLGTGVTLLGVRTDILNVAGRMDFFMQFLSSLALFFLSALSAFILSVPDRPKKWISLIPALTFSLWLLAISQSFFFVESLRGGLGISCVRDILLLSSFPAIFLFLMLRSAAPLQKGLVGALALLSVSTLGAVGTQLICYNDDPLHILLWHFLPVALIGLLGTQVGKFLFAWEK